MGPKELANSPAVCPNSQCPFLLEHGEPASYEGDELACEHCGTTLERTESSRRDGSSKSTTGTGIGKSRLRVTAAVVVGAALGQWFLELLLGQFRRMAYGWLPGDFSPEVKGVVYYGSPLKVFVFAAILVELASLLGPQSWRQRGGPPGARRSMWRAVIVVTVLLALAQPLGIAISSRSPALLLTGAVAQTGNLVFLGILLWLAKIVSRKGLGPGLGTILTGLLALSVLVLSYLRLYVLGSFLGDTPAHDAWFDYFPWWLPLLLLGALAYRWWTRQRESKGEREQLELPIPSSGAGIVNAGPLLLGWGATMSLLDRQFGTSAAGILFGLVICVALIPLTTSLFYSKRRVHELLVWFVEKTPKSTSSAYRGWNDSDKRDIDEQGRRLRAVATQRTMLWLGLYALAYWSVRLRFSIIASILGPMVPVTLAALGSDILAEYRAWESEATWRIVWREHRVYAAPIIQRALEQRDIQVHLRGLRLRSLLQFFGPHVPIEVMVPERQMEQALAVLKDLPRAGTNNGRSHEVRSFQDKESAKLPSTR